MVGAVGIELEYLCRRSLEISGVWTLKIDNL